MEKLSQLPEEVLARILDFYDVSHQVVALWLCGSSALNVRLARGGCYRFETPSNAKTILRWPPIVFELKMLDTVVMSGLTWLQSLSAVAQGIRRLPTRLKKLELRFPKSHWILEANHFSSKASFGSSSTVAYVPVPNPTMWDIGTAFPELEELTMVHRGADMEHHYMTSSVPLAVWPQRASASANAFPASLTKLDWDAEYKTDYEGLPRGLKFLSLRVQWPSPEALLTLPRGITSLSGIYIDNDIKVAALPPSLTDARFWTNNSPFTPEIAAALPCALTHFYACYIPPNAFGDSCWTASVPSSVTLSALHPMSIKEIAALPRTLKAINDLAFKRNELRYYLEDAEEAQTTASTDFWPPSLTRLTTAAPLVSLAEVALLPPTLHVLLGVSCSDEPSKILSSTSPDFPSNLQVLDLSASFFTSMLVIDRPLPSKITRLSFGKMDVSSFPMLPPPLLTLKMDALLGAITDDSFKALPKYLRTFHFKIPVTAPVPVNAFKSLPPYLTTLHMIYHEYLPGLARCFPSSITDLTLIPLVTKQRQSEPTMYFRD